MKSHSILTISGLFAFHAKAWTLAIMLSIALAITIAPTPALGETTPLLELNIDIR